MHINFCNSVVAATLVPNTFPQGPPRPPRQPHIPQRTPTDLLRFPPVFQGSQGLPDAPLRTSKRAHDRPRTSRRTIEDPRRTSQVKTLRILTIRLAELRGATKPGSAALGLSKAEGHDGQTLNMLYTLTYMPYIKKRAAIVKQGATTKQRKVIGIIVSIRTRVRPCTDRACPTLQPTVCPTVG